MLKNFSHRCNVCGKKWKHFYDHRQAQVSCLSCAMRQSETLRADMKAYAISLGLERKLNESN